MVGRVQVGWAAPPGRALLWSSRPWRGTTSGRAGWTDLMETALCGSGSSLVLLSTESIVGGVVVCGDILEVDYFMCVAVDKNWVDELRRASATRV